MWKTYIRPATIEDALNNLSKFSETSRVIAGATDLMLEMERGVRKGVDTLIDITSIPGLDEIRMDHSGWIHIGPLVTHNACASSQLIREHGFPLALASWSVGSPQIRNRATIAGNVITASPANDTISPLVALNAELTLQSVRGERKVRISDFYTGVRRNVMLPDELLVDISFKAMEPSQRGTFVKFALRKAQAISLVNLALVVSFNPESQTTPLYERLIDDASITLGAVAPTIIHAEAAEQFLRGKRLSDDVIEQAAYLTMAAARPINDIRGSASYRKTIVKVITRRALKSLVEQTEKDQIPESPVLLWGVNHNPSSAQDATIVLNLGDRIQTEINGQRFDLDGGCGKSLLRLLRENALLTGTKEACAEGECGACTVYLDGKAVLGCMIPAERAHGAKITTIEGIAPMDGLHPVQQGFIQAGAVQCGYCTPGLIMSTVKLIEEKPKATQEEIKQAIAGNLCRCTGYYKIIEAVEIAIRVMEK